MKKQGYQYNNILFPFVEACADRITPIGVSKLPPFSLEIYGWIRAKK